MIVAFTKDWDDVPTCTTHVLREMAKTIPVLWVNSIGTRKPDLAHPGHAGRVLQRALRGIRPAIHKENQLRVLSPLLIPKAQSVWAIRLNRRLMAAYIRREQRGWMGEGAIEYWCFVPNAVDLLPPPTDHRSPITDHFVIYYCVDDWGKFCNLDTAWLESKERRLLERADVVFTPARYLEEKCRAMAGDRVHYVPHGVEYRKFRAALEGTVPIPADVAAFPHPLVGFYGNIYPWIDFALIEKLALARPDWTFVLIGQVFCDVSGLEHVPNVHLLGRREHDELPGYCRAFDAAIIPYDLENPRMESVNPVKTRELLAAGVPVVAARIPELQGFGDHMRTCRSADEWICALEGQCARTDGDAISRSVADDDWTVRVRSIREVVAGMADRKR